MCLIYQKEIRALMKYYTKDIYSFFGPFVFLKKFVFATSQKPAHYYKRKTDISFYL